MARIAGINIPLNKRIEIGLTYIYGIGQSRSNEILGKAGVGRDTYVRDLTDDEILHIVLAACARRFFSGVLSAVQAIPDPELIAENN